ncbi:Glutathione reductase [Puccinia graminis f. sp. tritici]|uniref:Glutathione reductase n=1 Tax=Puccinia graminis f. sp. tritici TaxID=56615 RepID=A0A5B0SH18_PUCGR|nr:Glutathione reductase [Puccinia graminis f. sp. tritici]
MSPLPKHQYDYDLLVIGGGSGGLGCARRAAQYGAKVGIIERTPVLGGTCVNVGCVPKKVMWHAADVREKMRAAVHYCQTPESTKLPEVDWLKLKEKRDGYITRLNGIYERNVKNDKVDYLKGTRRLTAEKIVIAVGGRPVLPEIEGAELGIDSDGFFALEALPRRVAVVGAGYIAVELAGIFHAMGAETHLIVRQNQPLRTFDSIIRDTLTDHMEHIGIPIHKHSQVIKLSTSEKGPYNLAKPFPKTIETSGGEKIEVDCVLFAIGRKPLSDLVGCDKAGVRLDSKGKRDRDSVIGLYGGVKDDKISYENIATVVFSHPPCATVGLTEEEAHEKYGKESIKVYQSKFKAMYYSMMPEEEKEPTGMKLVCWGPDEKIVGIHMIGLGTG